MYFNSVVIRSLANIRTIGSYHNTILEKTMPSLYSSATKIIPSKSSFSSNTFHSTIVVATQARHNYLGKSHSFVTVCGAGIAMNKGNSMSRDPLNIFFPPTPTLKNEHKKAKHPIVNLLEQNDIKVINNTVPLIKPSDISKALELLQKEKILIQGLTLWKREGSIYFEIYWRKGLHLDTAIRELQMHSTSPTECCVVSASQDAVNFCIQKCNDFIAKITKDKESLDIEYFGLLLPKHI